jgi:hypothetical protein
MHTKGFSIAGALWTAMRIRSRPRRIRARLLPHIDVLEGRLALSTYTWTAGGDGTTWNDPNNWSHFDPSLGAREPGTPTAFSNVVFPPQAILPAGSSKTIDFNFTYLFMPLASLTIDDSYTFQGTPIAITQSLSLNNPFTSSPNGAVAHVVLAGMNFSPNATIYTQAGGTLRLGTTTATTGFLLSLQGPISKTGGGQLLIDTSSISFPTTPLLSPVPVSIAGGSITLGASVTLNAVNFDVAPTASLNIADNVAAGVRSLTGTGFVNLKGTTGAGDQTSLTVLVPNANTDIFGGLVAGTGQFIMGGFGTLMTGPINFQGAGGITAASGTLDVNGTISAGSLSVSPIATFGGLGAWSFSGPAVFQSGSTFLVTLDGTEPGSQYTQLVDTNTTSGVNLGFSTMAATIGYSYEESDLLTVISAPLIQNAFVNVIAGRAILDGVSFAVSTGATKVTLAPLQSLTSTGLTTSSNPAFPGAPVTFTAAVNTRTAPVLVGSVSFVQGGAVVATVPVNGGVALFTTTSLPLGTTSITAVYNGTAGNVSSTSPTLAQMIVPYPTATSLASALNPSGFGDNVAITASVVNAAGPVTAGTVTFRRGSQFLATVPLNASGTASMSLNSISVGVSRIQAIYSGAPSDLSSTSPVLAQTVQPLSTTTSLSLATGVKANGQVRYILRASVSAQALSFEPTGTVVFRKNGLVIGRAKLTGGAATLVLAGKTAPRGRFVAQYLGNPRFRVSTSAPLQPA